MQFSASTALLWLAVAWHSIMGTRAAQGGMHRLMQAGPPSSPAATCTSTLWDNIVMRDMKPFESTRVQRSHLDLGEQQVFAGWRVLVKDNKLYVKHVGPPPELPLDHGLLMVLAKAICMFDMPEAEFIMHPYDTKKASSAQRSAVFSFAKVRACLVVAGAALLAGAQRRGRGAGGSCAVCRQEAGRRAPWPQLAVWLVAACLPAGWVGGWSVGPAGVAEARVQLAAGSRWWRRAAPCSAATARSHLSSYLTGVAHLPAHPPAHRTTPRIRTSSFPTRACCGPASMQRLSQNMKTSPGPKGRR
jgi:hypothetical protein